MYDIYYNDEYIANILTYPLLLKFFIKIEKEKELDELDNYEIRINDSKVRDKNNDIIRIKASKLLFHNFDVHTLLTILYEQDLDLLNIIMPLYHNNNFRLGEKKVPYDDIDNVFENSDLLLYLEIQKKRGITYKTNQGKQVYKVDSIKRFINSKEKNAKRNSSRAYYESLNPAYVIPNNLLFMHIITNYEDIFSKPYNEEIDIIEGQATTDNNKYILNKYKQIRL